MQSLLRQVVLDIHISIVLVRSTVFVELLEEVEALL